MYSYPDGNGRRTSATYREAAAYLADHIIGWHGGCARSALAWWLRPIPAVTDADRWDRQEFMSAAGLTGHEGACRINYQLTNATTDRLRHIVDQGHDCGCAHLWADRDETGRPLITS